MENTILYIEQKKEIVIEELNRDLIQMMPDLEINRYANDMFNIIRYFTSLSQNGKTEILNILNNLAEENIKNYKNKILEEDDYHSVKDYIFISDIFGMTGRILNDCKNYPPQKK